MDAMVLSKSFLVLLTFTVTWSLELSSEESSDFAKAGRELRDFGRQNWRALDQFHSTVADNSGWIPHQLPLQDETEVTTKRRKIRKRKRRPPVMISLTEESDFIYPSRKRILRPQRLESWEQMTAENPQKPSHRRRITPNFEDSEEIQHEFEKIRDPFTALQEEEEKQRKKQEELLNPAKDLKSLLKSSGGSLSLSEILQQKNLSLSELLMGKKEAISAILEENLETSTNFDLDTTKYKRLPPSVALGKPQNNKNRESEIEELTSEEILEAQRKRLSLLHGHKDTKLFQDVVKVDVITEATTEKRIFVPAITTEMKPEIEEINKIAVTTEDVETSTLTTHKPTTARLEFTTNKVSYRPLLLKTTSNLPTTSAKLNKLTKTDEHNSVLPPKPIKIAVEELLGLQRFKTTITPESEDDLPLKMTIDLETFVVEGSSSEKPSQLEINQDNSTAEDDDKLKIVTAKEEIMEILENPVDREHLSRILKIRNMTVEELVQQRERGSSQLHLADIFHNDTREPEPKDEPFVGQVNADYFNNFPVFNRQQKSRAFPPTNSVVKKELSNVAPEEVTSKPKEQITITSFPTYKIETTKNVPQQPFLPIWKELYPSIFTGDQNRDQDLSTTSTSKPSTESFDYDDLQRLEELENRLEHEVTNDRLNVDLLQNDEEFIKLPTGVKSAILASFAIVGLSLMVFLTILVIFKWSQKQRRRLSYSSSFSGSKIKSPILESPNRRSLKSFMTETLGRKKNYYKNHLQSMSDSIWDSEKKPACYM